MLVSAPSDRLSSLQTLQHHEDPSVIVLPVWRGQVAVQERQGASGLWSNFLSPGETPLQAAIRVADTVSADASTAPAITCVARTSNVELCHANFGITCTMAVGPATQSINGDCQRNVAP